MRARHRVPQTAASQDHAAFEELAAGARSAGEALTTRTDVYQLAATAYVLLSGERPFSGDIAQTIFAVVRLPPVYGEDGPDTDVHIYV